MMDNNATSQYVIGTGYEDLRDVAQIKLEAKVLDQCHLHIRLLNLIYRIRECFYFLVTREQSEQAKCCGAIERSERCD